MIIKTQRISVVAVSYLKEALCVIYWYKNDLRSFLDKCICDKDVIAKVNWDNYKRQIVSDVIDILYNNQEKYLGDLRCLLYEVCQMEKFYHLEQLEDGERKVEKAKKAVEALKELVAVHDQKLKDDKEILERRKRAKEKLKSSQAVISKLNEICSSYCNLFSTIKPQQRGYELERIMYEIFSLFDLDPKASFKNIGEQIDGAFSLEGTEYLFEAKWQSHGSDAADFDSFSGKIRRKLENTLGLFLSINGFSKDAIQIYSMGKSNIILMDGGDLMAVLEGRIDFVSLLLRKKKYAARTGNIFISVNEILSNN
ncbi:restriction endonuclease [Clostridium butyricum]|uniref:restriction endonuclease n=1 Tax=Clostridium butyricum TaxID=1492 RepID=UPI001CA80D9C|nr:restriction endonuclease [Clostridium butyricum]MBZ0313341.1 restriction endonuclease [Clostridium butyricum]MDU5103080.1 restriction endonuclease [Clostridium butyricum]